MPQDVNVIGGARDLALGLNGAYFVASNPTPGTALAGHAAPTTFDDTKPLVYVFNPGPKFFVPLYLRLTLTAAATNSTNVRFVQAIDVGTAAAPNKYTSGGTLLAPVNPNGPSTNPSQVASSIYCGAVVAAAKTATRRVFGNAIYRTVIGVVGDVYQFCWAAHDQIDPASLITTGTAVSNVAFGYAPVAIGPNQSFLIHQWSPSQSGAPSFEVEFGYCEI